MSSVLIIEPFYGGSHKQMIDLLQSRIKNCDVVTMRAKKWHWRARASALYISQKIPLLHQYRLLFASSVLNLTELVALRPDLQNLRKILYFHENQLVYPVKKQQNRDFQYGYNQILSCLVADTIVFNSQYNMESFLSSINSYLNLMPDYRTKGLEEIIHPKCQVLYFPLDLPSAEECSVDTKNNVYRQEMQHSQLTQDNVAVHSKFHCQNSSTTTATCQQLEEKLKNMKIHEIRADNKNIQCECVTNIKDDLDTCSGKEFNRNQETSSIHGKPIGIEEQERNYNAVTFCGKGDNLQSVGDSVNLSTSDITESRSKYMKPLHIVWAHRWEHDKDPETFFAAMLKLSEAGCQFHLSVLGEQFSEIPEIFMKAKHKLEPHIVNWGYQESKEDYFNVLKEADVAVSTALHEFFGVSMLEAVYFGCYPLCPKRLVYPEIFPEAYLYNTTSQLVKTLKRFCKFPAMARDHQCKVQIEKYLWRNLGPHYVDLLLPENKMVQSSKDGNP